jgi:metal-responsive CopG/Arc/MetJ family transcriptional regulator
MTKRTAISLPDALYRDIERARKRSKKDRSTWIQEAASEYLKRRTEAEDVEAYFAAYERIPLSEDELAAIRHDQARVGRIIDALDRK